MQYNKVKICGINTSELKIPSETEKINLLKLTKSGDKTAREKLINGNLRLVLSIIQRFSGRGEMSEIYFKLGVLDLLNLLTILTFLKM